VKKLVNDLADSDTFEKVAGKQSVPPPKTESPAAHAA
jgi:hypothetical protein